MSRLHKIGLNIFKAVASVVMVALLAIFATGVSPVYDFTSPDPFSGPAIYNPYSNLDTLKGWKRANFHVHTRVDGIFNECEKWPGEVYEDLRRFGYDIVTFSNHNRLTAHPSDTALQVNVYEHGYNLFKYHKLVFGSRKVNRFDHLLPVFTFQKQFQLDMLGKDSDFIQMNHPLRTEGTSKKQMERLEGYRIMELDSGKSTENEYWDWALSAGKYSFALANDDLHYPDRSSTIAIRCNFLNCQSASYEDIRSTLMNGCYYSMRIPDYGNGDWDIKYARNMHLPSVEDIGMEDDTIYMLLSEEADSIKVTGQGHTTLAIAKDTCSIRYAMKDSDPYARMTAYFPEGEVIYTNVFARYDPTVSDSPFAAPSHKVNILLTILYNSVILLLCIGMIMAAKKLFRL